MVIIIHDKMIAPKVLLTKTKYEKKPDICDDGLHGMLLVAWLKNMDV